MNKPLAVGDQVCWTVKGVTFYGYVYALWEGYPYAHVAHNGGYRVWVLRGELRRIDELLALGQRGAQAS